MFDKESILQKLIDGGAIRNVGEIIKAYNKDHGSTNVLERFADVSFGRRSDETPFTNAPYPSPRYSTKKPSLSKTSSAELHWPRRMILERRY